MPAHSKVQAAGYAAASSWADDAVAPNYEPRQHQPLANPGSVHGCGGSFDDLRDGVWVGDQRQVRATVEVCDL